MTSHPYMVVVELFLSSDNVYNYNCTIIYYYWPVISSMTNIVYVMCYLSRSTLCLCSINYESLTPKTWLALNTITVSVTAFYKNVLRISQSMLIWVTIALRVLTIHSKASFEHFKTVMGTSRTVWTMKLTSWTMKMRSEVVQEYAKNCQDFSHHSQSVP